MSEFRFHSGRIVLPTIRLPVWLRRWRLWNTTFAVLLAGLYTLFLLISAFLVGSILADLARDFAQRNGRPVLTTEIHSEVSADIDSVQPPADRPVVVQKAEEEKTPSLAPLPRNQINILLLGTDERINDEGPPLTDTILLLTLNLGLRTAGMISFPRDLWVPIPGYNQTTKINTAYTMGERRGYPGGGAQLAKDTVSSFIGQPVQYYVQVNFNGFVRFIDHIGGVAVDVPQTIHDEQYPTPDFKYQTFHLDAGYQQLDGETALKYARTRNPDNDYGRAARQQQLVQAVVDKVLSADMTPTLIANAYRLMSTMQASVQTDMPLPKVIDIARDAYSNPFAIERRVVLDARYGEESWSENEAWILLPDRQRIRATLRQFFDITASPATGRSFSSAGGAFFSTDAFQANPSSAVHVPAARDARVEILNGTGYPGIAARVRAELQARGWRVVAIGDADRSDYQRTLLVNYNTDENFVREIGRQLNLPASLYTFPGLLIPNSADLRIVVGRDYLTNVLDDTH